MSYFLFFLWSLLLHYRRSYVRFLEFLGDYFQVKLVCQLFYNLDILLSSNLASQTSNCYPLGEKKQFELIRYTNKDKGMLIIL